MPAVDEAKLNAFVGQMLGDLGGAMSATLVRIGDRLGLYKALHQYGPQTVRQLAERTSVAERYLAEWLANQAASGYLTYQPETQTFELPAEQAMVFAIEDSPLFMLGAFDCLVACFADGPKLEQAFQTGQGIGWGDHQNCLFCGTERFFRPGYRANLVASWLPALDGVVEKLTRGAKVADAGCGHGVSTILMAKAFPNSTFVGFDFHPQSIAQAAEHAATEGVTANLRFEVAAAKTYPGRDYDLVACFDCLHDMGDPVGAAAHVRESLAADGTWLIVEPFAHDRLEDNLNPVGRIFYAASTMICVPTSLGQEVGAALGAQAGEARIRQVVQDGGFKRFRRAAETPFNLIFEARP